MDHLELFRHKLISIPEAVGLVQTGQTISTGIAASEAVGLLSELGNHKDRLQDVHVWVCLPMRPYDYALKPEMAGHFYVDNWFYGAADRQVHSQGRVTDMPNNLHKAATDRTYASKGRLNVFCGTAPPPD